MTIFTFANNVNTTLAGAISSSSTSLTLASAYGLPASIPSGQFIAITLNDAATQQNFEIIYASAVSGATLSGLVRGREGTSALSWGVGDFAYSPPTAGQMGNFLQIPSVGRLLSAPRLITATEMFTPNPLATMTIVEGVGGSGASGGCAATTSTTAAASAGGSCGSYAKIAIVGAISGTVACTIGAGGTVGAAGAVHGNAGGATTFGAYLTCPGGDGGVGGAAVTAGFVTNPTYGSVHLPTTTGQFIVYSGTALGGPGAVLGLTPGQQLAGQGTQCIYGFPASGFGGSPPGVVNAASQSALTGNPGRLGCLIVWEYS